jgi:hypothetical protein
VQEHTDITGILAEVVGFIGPIKGGNHCADQNYQPHRGHDISPGAALAFASPIKSGMIALQQHRPRE